MPQPSFPGRAGSTDSLQLLVWHKCAVLEIVRGDATFVVAGGLAGLAAPLGRCLG